MKSIERRTAQWRAIVAFVPVVASVLSLVVSASFVPAGIDQMDLLPYGAATALAGAAGLALFIGHQRGRTLSTLVLVAPFVHMVILLGPLFRSPLALANSDYQSPFEIVEAIFRERTVAWALVRATGTGFAVPFVAVLLARSDRRAFAPGAGAWMVLATLAGILCVVGGRLGALESSHLYRGRIFDVDDIELLGRWSVVETASMTFDALVVVASLALAFRWRACGSRAVVVPIVAFAAGIALQRAERLRDARELVFARATPIAGLATPVAWCDLHAPEPVHAVVDAQGRILSTDGRRPLDAERVETVLRRGNSYDSLVILADRNLRGSALRALIRRPTGQEPILFEAKFGPLDPRLDSPSLRLRTLPYLGALLPMRVQCQVARRPLERVPPARTFEVLRGGALREVVNPGETPPFDRYFALRVTDETTLEDLVRALARFGRWGPHPSLQFADELRGPPVVWSDHFPYVELDGT